MNIQPGSEILLPGCLLWYNVETGEYQVSRKVKTRMELLERIPAQDWEATPASVRALLLSLLPLETEVSALRARLQAFDQNMETSTSRIQLTNSNRYQELVEKLMISGLSAEETQEMERLGTQMDTESAPFYEAALPCVPQCGDRKSRTQKSVDLQGGEGRFS